MKGLQGVGRSLALFGLAGGIAIVPVLELPGVAQTVVQNQTSEIDSAISEGMRLFREGSAESLRKAISQFERALQLSRSTKVLDKQAFSLLVLGRIYNALGENQKALDYYNQALPLHRAVGNRSDEAMTLNDVGAVYSALGEKQKALDYHNQALPLYRAVGDRSGAAITLNNIGFIYNALGENQKALDYYNQALPLYRAVGNRSDEAVTLNNIGLVYSNLGENQKALNYHNQALPLYRAVGDRSGEATTLNRIGQVYDALGEKQKALDYYNQALLLHRAVGDRSGAATILNNIGRVYDALGEKQKALDYFNQALPLSRAVGNRSGEAMILNNIGLVYFALGENQKALDYYNQALSIQRAVGDRSGAATTLNNIGGVYDALGKNQKALDYYNQALPLHRAVGSRSGETMTLNNIGLVYSALGEKQKALDYYNQALLLHRAVGDRSGEAIILNNIGSVYSALGEKQKALDYYNQALLLHRAVGDRSGEAATLNNIGSVYSALGEKQKALDYYNQALPLRRAVRDRSGEAITLNDIGAVYSALGEKQKALDYYNQALPLYRAVGNRSGEAITLNNVGYAFADLKQPQLAIVIFKQSVNVYESIRQDNQKLPKELRESYTKSISHTYQKLADLLIKQGRLPEAQAVLELLKIKELNTYTRDAGTASKGISFTPAEQQALTEVFQQYGTAASFANKISECAQTRCPDLQLQQLLDDRDRVNTAIRAMLDRLRVTLQNQVIDISKLNTGEFQDAAEAIVNAQPGTVLIYPVITETKIQFLLAFKAGAGGQAPVTFRAIDGPNLNSEDLFKTTNDFRTALSSPSSDLQKLQATSQKLYNWLIKPLEPEINHSSIKHLVFVGDRATRHIPLAALHDGKEYLSQKTYTLTTVLAAKTTDPKATQPQTPIVLAVGASEFKTAPELPYVDRELSAIVQTPQTQKGIFPGNLYLNRQFTFDSLRDNLSGHNILHIATHGNLDPVNIDNSYLLTSSGEQINKPKIQLLRDYGLRNVHMVILSACDTGTSGKNSDNLEVAGISHYFMQGGAKAVIASLWKVNDPATARFMQQFYKHLKDGMTKAQAIQRVQQEFMQGKSSTKAERERSDSTPISSDLQTSSSYAHPYYWAPFILIGNNL